MYRNLSTVILGGVFALVLLAPSAAGAAASGRATITGEMKYDSNIYSTEDATEDFVLTVSPEFSAEVKSRRTAFSALYRPSGLYYLSETQNNTVNHYGRGALTYGLSPTSMLALEDTVSYSQDTLESAPGSIVRERGGVLLNTLAARLSKKQSRSVDVWAAASSTSQRYDDPSAVDTRTDTIGAGLTKELSNTTSLSASYEFRNFSFNDGADHSTSQHLGLSATRQITPSSRIEASAGAYLRRDGDEDTGWEASAEYTVNFPSSVFAIGYSRRITPSSGIASGLNLNENINASLDLRLSRTVDALFSAGYSAHESLEGAPVDVDSVNAGVRFSYRLSDTVAASAGYSRFMQWSNTANATDLARDVVFVNMTVSPGSWRF